MASPDTITINADAVRFIGDLGDPWVAAIAEALPRGTVRFDRPDDWADVEPPAAGGGADLVLYRATLGNRDREAMAAWRQANGAGGRLILVIGPHARHHQVERWIPLADVVLPEATAAATIGRYFAAVGDAAEPPDRPTVTVVGGGFDLRSTLVEAVRLAGYPATGSRDWPDEPPGPLVWDVPVLDPGWPVALTRQARRAPVVALLGIAERESVRIAKEAGAAACLDSTCEAEDLAFVLDRLTTRMASRPGARLRVDAAGPAPPRRAGAALGVDGRSAVLGRSTGTGRGRDRRED